MSAAESGGKLAFLDSLTRIFRGEGEKAEAPAAAPAPAAPRMDALTAEFEAAIRGLDQKVKEHHAKSLASRPDARLSKDEAAIREAERRDRMEAAHRAIRADVEAMHARLGTGISGKDLDTLASYLAELDASVRSGRDSHEMLPRARYAIARKLQSEAGELAVARLIERMADRGMAWPDPSQQDPTATADEIERSRRRRLAETREAFLASGLQRTAERLLGVVTAWGSDYPKPGSPIWEEAVLEGVAAGLRGRLVREFVEVLERDREKILAELEDVIGKEVAALRQTLSGGVTSIDQANLAVAGALGVLDTMVPEIAWEDVRSRVPEARGQWS